MVCKIVLGLQIIALRKEFTVGVLSWSKRQTFMTGKKEI